MPEYSSTTITPSDGVQVPGMNGSTSGNLLLSALKSYILSEKGLANGLASLDANGKLPSSQLPDLADDVIVVASYASLPATGTAGKIYITADNNKMYRWDPELTTPDYVELSIDLSEYAKIVDIQDGNIQAGVAVKAFQDAMGRAIITTYETKADASDLKDAISGLQKQIDNITEAEDLLLTVDYKNGETAVPPNVSEYAEVGVLKGVSRVANQFVASVYARPETYGLTRQAMPNGGLRIYGTCTQSTDYTVAVMNGLTSGHTCLTSFGNVSLPTGCRISASSTDKASSSVSVVTATVFGIYVTSGLTIDITLYPICRDLTLYFNGNIPSGLDIAMIQQNYPELLEYSDYNAGSIVDSTYSAVESRGVNIWDEEWEVGTLVWATGEPQDSTTFFRSKNYIPAKPNTRYYTTFGIVVYAYDKDYNMLLQVNTGENARTFIYDTPSGTAYLRFRTYYQMTVYGNNIQICDNSLPDAVKTTYHPYTTDTLTLPSPVTLKGAGSVSEMYYPETGRVTHPLSEEVNLANYTWTYSSSLLAYYTNDLGLLAKLPASNEEKGDIIASKYVVTEAGNMSNDGEIALRSNGQLLVRDSTQSGNPSGTFVYALASPSADTYVDPLPNNYIKVEPNGTAEAVQSQSQKVDGAMTVTFTKKVSA